jgi:trehalose 6-phosphate phosphatase
LAEVLRPLAEREGLRLHQGRLVWELRPPVDMDKGQVLRALVESRRPGGVIYVGDDVTDADGFAALKTMVGVPTLAVGVRSSEVPAGTFADCDLVLNGVPQVTRLLADLLARCP